MINNNLHSISYRFEVIADYCWNFGGKTIILRFWPSFGGLVATYAVGSLESPLLTTVPILVNWKCFDRCYGWDATNEYLLEIGVFGGVGQFRPKFEVEGDVNHQPFFARLVRPMNAVQLCCWQYSHKETL